MSHRKKVSLSLPVTVSGMIFTKIHAVQSIFAQINFPLRLNLFWDVHPWGDQLF